MVHALARLAFNQFDVSHLFLVINRLEKFVADSADFDHRDHPSVGRVKSLAGREYFKKSCNFMEPLI